jgi:hypothetical protein
MRTAEGFAADSSNHVEQEFSYPGRELEAMAGAYNYHRWILEIFKPYLGKQLVEVGAGRGSFSELILGTHDCDRLSLVEPSAELYQELTSRIGRLKTDTEMNCYQQTFAAAASLIKERQAPDSVIYVNVLEHIADDELELKTINRTLVLGGRVFLFVPALPKLYGAFDDRVGHVRRYTRSELDKKLLAAGFKLVLSKYFDFTGIAPWWVKYCLLRSDNMPGSSVKFYDRFVIPFVSRIETLISPPLGKNIIAIGEKVSD